MPRLVSEFEEEEGLEPEPQPWPPPHPQSTPVLSESPAFLQASGPRTDVSRNEFPCHKLSRGTWAQSGGQGRISDHWTAGKLPRSVGDGHLGWIINIRLWAISQWISRSPLILIRQLTNSVLAQHWLNVLCLLLPNRARELHSSCSHRNSWIFKIWPFDSKEGNFLSRKQQWFCWVRGCGKKD